MFIRPDKPQALDNLDFQTQAIRAQTERTQYNEHSTPLFLTSSFVFDTAEAMRAAFSDESDDFIYSRYSNPTVEELVGKVCLLEDAEAGIATASGMAAIYDTMMSLLRSGDHVVSCSSVFGATHAILTKYFPKIGISHSYFDAGQATEEIAALMQPNTRLLYLETPTNPAIALLDLQAIGALCKERGVILVVDNCFATPYLQQPTKWGADIVIHSATKYMDGQGRVLGGIVVGRADLVREIYLFNRLTGAAMSPFNAWVLSKSLETLALRMERHCANALFVAEQLQSAPNVDWVSYPFLPTHPQHALAKRQMRAGGGIVALQIAGGYEGGKRFLDKLKMIRISPNLGDARSIATHPASSTHCKLSEAERLRVGISQGLVRLSIGLEAPQDILNDLLQALGQN